MSDELDLERGDEKRAERIAAAKEEQEAGRTRRNRDRDSSGRFSRGGSGGDKRGGSSKSDTGLVERRLVERLITAFNKLADQRETRDDTELAEAIREDARAMSRGLVSMTRTLVFLRAPLLLFLGFLEPVLAFWHVGGILIGRFVERRQRVMQEREMAAANVTETEPELVPVS